MFIFRSSYSLAEKEKILENNYDRDLRLPRKIPIDIRNLIRIFVLAISDILAIALEVKNEVSGGVLFKIKDNPRITKIGQGAY